MTETGSIVFGIFSPPNECTINVFFCFIWQNVYKSYAIFCPGVKLTNLMILSIFWTDKWCAGFFVYISVVFCEFCIIILNVRSQGPMGPWVRAAAKMSPPPNQPNACESSFILYTRIVYIAPSPLLICRL